MKLKVKVDTIEGMDASIAGLYEKGDDGKYYLSLDGYDHEAPTKIKEFRQNNIDLQKKVKEFEDKYKDIDLDKYKELIAKEQQMREKKLLEEGDIDKLVEEKTERMRQDYEGRVERLESNNKELQDKAEKAQKRLKEVLIDSEITKAVLSISQPRQNAMQLILSLGRETWDLNDDGNPVPTKGGKLLYGKDGKTLMTFEEWVETVTIDRPFLFETVRGAETKGSQKKTITGGTAAELMDMDAGARLERMFTTGAGIRKQ